MIQFSTSREKRLWFTSLTIVLVIFSTLFIGRPLIDILRNQDIQAVFFVLGMLLVGLSLLLNGLWPRSKVDVGLLLGLLAVYVMLFLRLGLPERSHLIEYSVLTIFIQKALTERSLHKKLAINKNLATFLIATCIGIIDEVLQLFLPDRRFDYYDIVFNSMAIGIAIVSILAFEFGRKFLKKKNKIP